MRRPFTISSFALAMALAPAILFAQATPPAQPPAGQQPAAPAPAQPAAKPAGPKLTFKANAGMLLVQVKPDQTAAFEEMITKLKTATATASDPQVKQQSQMKSYRSAEAAPGGNVFYILLYDPATAGAEYNWLDVINTTMTPDQQRDPATREMYARFAASVASMNSLNLTEIK